LKYKKQNQNLSSDLYLFDYPNFSKRNIDLEQGFEVYNVKYCHVLFIISSRFKKIIWI